MAPGQEQQVQSDLLDGPQVAKAVVRGGIWRISAFVSANLLAIVMAAIIVRYLGVRGLARYATVVSLTTLVFGLFEAGLGNVGIREGAVLHGTARASLLRSLLGLRFTVALVGSLVALAAALALGFSSEMVVGVGVSSLGTLVYTLQTHYATMLQVNMKWAHFSALEVARQAVLTLLAAAFVALNFHMVALLAASIPANLVVLLATLRLVRGTMPLAASFRFNRWRGIVGKSVVVAAATAASVVYSQIAVILMSQVSNQSQTGLFSASFRIFAVLAAIPGLLVASTLPVLSRAANGPHERMQTGLARTCDVSALLGAGMAALTVVGAPVAIAIVAGPAFNGSIGVLRIHGAALLPTSLIAFAGYGLMSMGAYRTILVSTLLGLVVAMILIVSLGIADGAPGAAIGNLAGESSLAALYVTAILRRRFVLPWRTPLLATVSGSIATIAGLAAPVPSLAQLLLAGVTYAALAFSLGIIPRELLQALPPFSISSR